MKFKKKHFFNIHSWIGVQLSILFFIVCFSGTIAVFSHELDWLFNPAMRAKPTKELASKNKIITEVKEQFPNGKITFWMKSHEPYLTDIIYFQREDKSRVYIFANQYTGKVQGSAGITIQRFFRDLHYYLFIPFQIGHFTVLLFAFFLLGSLISGWKFIANKKKHLTKFKAQKSALANNKNLHKTLALWSIPFIILFSITGVWYFTERTNLFSISKYIKDERVKETSVKEKLGKNMSFKIDYDKCIAIAKQEIPHFTFGSVQVPRDETKPIELRGKSKVPLVRYRANRVILDPNTYEVLQVQKAEETHTLKTINNIADPLHFGNFGGLFTKVIWFIFGAFISYLVASGLWIYLKRTTRRSKGNYKFLYFNFIVFAVLQFFMYQKLIFIYKISFFNHVIILLFWLFFLALFYYVYVHRIKNH